MTTRKRRPTASGIPAPRDGSLTLDEALGPRPGRADEARDRAWLAARRRIDEMTIGGEWDCRRALTLPTDKALTRWHTLRRAWLAERWTA